MRIMRITVVGLLVRTNELNTFIIIEPTTFDVLIESVLIHFIRIMLM